MIKRSTRASNPEGLLEKELKAREQTVRYQGYRYKKRRCVDLTSSEVTAIVHSYLVEHLSQ